MIILQLKSAQRKADLDSISHIISKIRNEKAYRIKGHEIQQVESIMNQTSLTERADLVLNFCAKNDIEFLTYHTPIFLDGENLWDEKWKTEIKNSIVATADEAEIVFSKAGLREKIIVVVHTTNFVPREELPIDEKKRDSMMEDTAIEFINFYLEELTKSKHCSIAIENLFPAFHGSYGIVGPFHPLEITKFEKYGIGTVLDFAHYAIYSNYLKSGREIYWNRDSNLQGELAPDWPEAIGLLSKSLVQLHINDAKGEDATGESLPLGQGEIPLLEVITSIASTIKRRIRGTIEIMDGHLNENVLQLRGTEWLLSKVGQGILE